MNQEVTSGRYIIVFEGKLNCLDECQYLISDSSSIRAGAGYKFLITGIYQNGYTEVSAESNELIYACEAPSLLSPPELVSVSATEITLKWDYPLRQSNCEIDSFALFMNDGLGGDTYTEIDSAAIRGKPHYR